MSTESSTPPYGMLGLLVLGGGIGFTLVMAWRSGPPNALLATLRVDLHLVAASLLVMVGGVAVALYDRRE